ncbi:uncharacterized protein LOC111705491 isoform X2 [Eurytemora carolleeae]|uniref:uncharacterized protein LOC111705491 isoform X2 n=1 Tax=Eurytemora carolleeae TaxID=1294199 RepID=UPI000C76B421|nr:uncharacterized protein LOC111705491 isoform X2 [Eurytemora carolleeae]|eukprot:XP_023333830.1 uncharacterized protein LOC111705491 isoform X2 [Eurytemora affinis]
MAGLGVSDVSPFLQVRSTSWFPYNRKDSCIICVGSTGSGKSSTIAIFTGNQVATSDSTISVTKHCQLYPNLLDQGASAWLDTVGWEDKQKDDTETFREILLYIHENNIASVLAVIWCVTPQVRTDASLRRQAEFINKLKEMDIWQNVIIVVKQSINPRYDAKGALAALGDYSNGMHIQVVGYRFLSDLAFSQTQRDLLKTQKPVRELLNVLTDDEIRDILQLKIASIAKPVQIIFLDSVCVECGQQGDVRLMGEYCHMEAVYKHKKESTLSHPKPQLKFHPSDRLFQIHLGDVVVGPCGRVCGCGPCSKPRYKCCGKKEASEGCRQVLVCCRNSTTSQGCKKKVWLL